MQRAAVLSLAGMALAAMPAHAGSAAYGEAFVGAFAQACVPARLSYPGTRANAETLGWATVERSAHPELDAMMAVAEAELESDPEMQPTFEYQAYSKPVEGQAHYLVVARSSFVVSDPADPWVFIGCYLYNFDAAEPIDPAPVTALIGNPIAQQVDQDGLRSWSWGPPCPMPRTGDTYLSHVSEGSPHVSTTGFSGLMLKFQTSEPDPGEAVPETYC